METIEAIARFEKVGAIARRRASRVMRLTGHNQILMMAHFNTVEDYLGREIVEFTHRLV
ncbi:hypothetical protein [Mesorhizobium sp.]|uniref:hypothetical protein n=1 Tax=Mesorhizobium sp. TaxID=1871066 RepID=UPI0025D06B35|nr:hypothetical protein [Mesorhizobium sp.]